MSTTAAHNLLVTAHGHPDFSLGGGEIAAYELFKSYRKSPAVGQATFLARAEDPAGWPSGTIHRRRENEYLWYQGVHDWHNHRSVHRESLRTSLADLVKGLKPTAVHAHHYAHMGLDYLVALRRLLPEAGIYLTLHEFMAICRHNGQMIKTGSLELCKRATPQDCQRCFPEHSAEDFWLRREFILDRLSVVDGFVSPSEFLRQRYIDWGIPAERIVMIENGQPASDLLAPRELHEGETRNRFAFFGQVNPYKGLDLVLRALTLLKKKERKQLVLEVHAANFDKQPQELRERVQGYLDPLIKEGVVQWVGPYRPEDMRRRLANVDWVVVPSIWWENSPLVIQEAFGAGRPLVCSDIGGMAEKIRHDVDGLHVPVGNALEWSRTLLKAATTDGLWERLAGGIRPVFTHEQCVEAHLEAFARFGRR